MSSVRVEGDPATAVGVTALRMTQRDPLVSRRV
jgi:hypothetical protein